MVRRFRTLTCYRQTDTYRHSTIAHTALLHTELNVNDYFVLFENQGNISKQNSAIVLVFKIINDDSVLVLQNIVVSE